MELLFGVNFPMRYIISFIIVFSLSGCTLFPKKNSDTNWKASIACLLSLYSGNSIQPIVPVPVPPNPPSPSPNPPPKPCPSNYDQARYDSLSNDKVLVVFVGALRREIHNFITISEESFDDIKTPRIIIGVPFNGKLYRIEPDLPVNSTDEQIYEAIRRFNGIGPYNKVERFLC